MDRKGKRGAWAFRVFFALTLLVMLTVLELNKNTVPGWLLCLAAAVLFVILRRRAGNRGLRFLCWVGWLGVFAAILALTWPKVRPVPAVGTKNPAYTQEVTTLRGRVRGPFRRGRRRYP